MSDDTTTSSGQHHQQRRRRSNSLTHATEPPRPHFTHDDMYDEVYKFLSSRFGHKRRSSLPTNTPSCIESAMCKPDARTELTESLVDFKPSKPWILVVLEALGRTQRGSSRWRTIAHMVRREVVEDNIQEMSRLMEALRYCTYLRIPERYLPAEFKELDYKSVFQNS